MQLGKKKRKMSDVKIGDTFKILAGTPKPYKAHVVAIVDEDMVVYKWYGRHKQWWHYKVEHIDIIQYKINNPPKNI